MSPGVTSLSCSPVEEVEDDRPSSSLSTCSRASSRIPVLQRSASLRLKIPPNQTSTPKPTTRGRRGVVRSASFVSSRGMGLNSPSGITPLSVLHHPSSAFYHPSSTPSTTRTSPSTPTAPSRSSFSHHTPETPRRYSHAGSYARRSGPERKTHASQPETPSRSPEYDADDTDSVKSFGSVASAMSCDAALATRGAYHTHHSHHSYQHKHGGGGKGSSGGKMKYALHCPHNHDNDPVNYLTPTQRAARRIRELKSQLAEARREVHFRDADISRLTRELVELRLLKARTHQQDDQQVVVNGSCQTSPTDAEEDCRQHAEKHLSMSNGAPSAIIPTPKTSATPSEGSEPELSRLMDNLAIGGPDAGMVHAESPASVSVAETAIDSVDLICSADSGHYDDLTSPCHSSKDSFEQSQSSSTRIPRQRELVDEDDDEEVDPWTTVEEVEARMREESETRIREEVEMTLREEFERREDQLKRNNMDEYHELKEKHNDHVESLLSKLSDANLKYFEIRPMYDRSQEKVRELEREVVKLKDELTEAEARHQKMYLQMFLKGQQAARMQADDEQDGEDGSQSSVSSGGPMVDLMKQLSRTEDDLEKMKALYHREVACRNNNTTPGRNGALDPEVTLQFLKSAFYYFLTDKDNSKGHLRAIESILGYSDSERYNIGKVVK